MLEKDSTSRILSAITGEIRLRIGLVDRQLFADFGGISAELGFFFNDGDIVADFCRIQGRGNAGDAAADDQNLSW